MKKETQRSDSLVTGNVSNYTFMELKLGEAALREADCFKKKNAVML